MATPDDTPDPADGNESAAASGPARKARPAVLVVIVIVIVIVVGVLIAVGFVAVLIGQSRPDPNPLDPDAPALADFTVRPRTSAAYEPVRGGLVAHFVVSTRDAGRFTVDVEAVTDEGADSLDISTPHVLRYTVPFSGGPSRQEFDVVVPLTEADYEGGYRQCRYIVNGTE